MLGDSLEISQSTIDRLISLFDNANEGLWIADTAGSIVFYNQSFYQQFGLAINDAQLSDWVERVHPSDKEKFK